MRTQWGWDVECLTSNWCSEMWMLFSIVADIAPSNSYSVTHSSEPSNRLPNYDLHILAFPHPHILLFSLSCFQLFATPWTTAAQASVSFTISWSSWNMFIESVMPFNHLVPAVPFSSCLLSVPASGAFPVSWLFASGGQSTGASASASVLPKNI